MWKGYPELADDNASMSSGSMSPDLGEMWRYGCTKSPDWDSEVEVCSVEEEGSECVMGHLRYVMEGPLWVPVRVFLVLDGVLYMRTTAVKWNIAGLYGPFAELFCILMKKDGKKRPLPSEEEAKRATVVWGSTRMHRGRVPTQMCETALLTAWGVDLSARWEKLLGCWTV